jgi:hypothetical protein
MHDITKSSRYEQDIRLGARRVSDAALILEPACLWSSRDDFSAE